MSARSLENNVSGYVLQMAIKLFVANIIETQFYITLDADIILLRSFEYKDVIIDSINETDGEMSRRGLYENEPREVHMDWWVHSTKLLRLIAADSGTNAGYRDHRIAGRTDGGFGVTPAVLSVWGSHTVINRLQALYGDDMIEKKLLENFNENIWTEYTLYALLLYDYGVFDALHIEQDINDRKILHCNDVWYNAQLPWNAQVWISLNFHIVYSHICICYFYYSFHFMISTS